MKWQPLSELGDGPSFLWLSVPTAFPWSLIELLTSREPGQSQWITHHIIIMPFLLAVFYDACYTANWNTIMISYHIILFPDCKEYQIDISSIPIWCWRQSLDINQKSIWPTWYMGSNDNRYICKQRTCSLRGAMSAWLLPCEIPESKIFG